ncbi:MAG TPA: four-helix bundle copper-binding protein [Methylophilaceae bacterium]|nr:four-helix bundle copper-binding protein [Methylophilaceae bacterium]HQR61068.1 four-helix bundle copper-binding protein [Methylophilaceae bacterium]
MNRRDILKTTGAIALAALAADALATEEHQHDHAAKGGHEGMKNPNQKLISAASDCVLKGELCIDHCLMLLADGEKEMAACARSVHQLLALCSALQQLASYQTPQFKALAKVAMEGCKECEDECRKHEKKHAVCHDCAESCAACYKECKAITA